MSSLESDRDIVNLKLFKLFRFYHVIDPSTRKVFNINVYRLILSTLLVVSIILHLYGMLGWFIEMDDDFDDFSKIVLIFMYWMSFSIFLKIPIFLYNADNIWDLFDLARVDFLTSNECQKYIYILYKYGNISKITSRLLGIFSVGTLITWCSLPLVMYNMQSSSVNTHSNSTTNSRNENVFNNRYPVSTYTYNNHFILFYIMELAIMMFHVLVYVAFDIFIISFGFVLMAQYEIVARAYENIGQDGQMAQNHRNVAVDNVYNSFKSIIFDHQKLYLKLKLYYSILWYIIVTSVIINSGGIMILSYSFIKTYLTVKSIPLYAIFKVLMPFFSLFLDLLFFCYVMENINQKKESVAYGIYSCNWTALNLKMKKFVLLLMQMEASNKLMMKITMRKVINLQLFASVSMTTYNIISVIYKSESK